MATSGDDILSRVCGTIARRHLPEPPARVLAAVSGGADSMALLHVLLRLGYRVEVAHLDHGTRAGESTEDARFVRETTVALGLPFHLETRDIPAEKAERGESFEQVAREARYAFLRRVAEARGCAAIATGHHADDQAETVLMRVLRGTSPGGFSGIPALRREGTVAVMRPLIDCTREEIRAWLKAEGIPWREDRTNAELETVRNRVRHELLPAMASVNPGIRDALLRLAETQAVENEYLATAANEALDACVKGDQLDRAAFAALPEALRRRVMQAYARRLGRDLDHDRLAAAAASVALGHTGTQVDLGGGALLYLGRSHAEPARPASVAEKALEVPGEVSLLGLRCRARLMEAVPPDLPAYCHARRQVLDADAVGGALLVRTRRPGDRFRPLGMKGTRKLQDWFVDAGVPGPARDRRLVFEAAGAIVWVAGGPPSADSAVTARTARFLEILLDDAPE